MAYSDICAAAKEFVRSLAEQGTEGMWDFDDIDALVDSLTERAFALLVDPELRF